MSHQRQIHVKPAPGRQVRQPERHGAHLPAEGAVVPRSEYYLRRLADGDLVEIVPTKTNTRPARVKRAEK